MTAPWVDDDVIDRICEGLSQPAAKVKALKRLGLVVKTSTSGRPLVLQANFDQVFGGIPSSPAATEDVASAGCQPDRAGLVLQFSRRRA